MRRFRAFLLDELLLAQASSGLRPVCGVGCDVRDLPRGRLVLHDPPCRRSSVATGCTRDFLDLGRALWPSPWAW